jgi:hypothetical protein
VLWPFELITVPPVWAAPPTEQASALASDPASTAPELPEVLVLPDVDPDDVELVDEDPDVDSSPPELDPELEPSPLPPDPPDDDEDHPERLMAVKRTTYERASITPAHGRPARGASVGAR